MGIGRVLGAAAPIAAGYFLPGSATLFGSQLAAQIAAGAATGAGIAALSGDDPLTGAVTGGLGGMTGGGLSSAKAAAESAKLASIPGGVGTTGAANKLVTDQALMSPYTTMSSNVGSNLGGMQATINPAISSNVSQIATGRDAMQGVLKDGVRDFTPGGYEFTTAERAVLGTPDASVGIGDVAEKFGGGSRAMGYGKMGLAGLGVAGQAGAFDPEPIKLSDDRDKYDPNARLNLSMNTGIDEALRRDTGLRLLAQGGEVQRYNNGGMAMYGMTPAAPPPKYGIIDVGGKFVETSKTPGPGLISDSVYNEQYGQTTAEKNQQGGGGGGMDPNLDPAGAQADDKGMNPGAISALAAGFAQQQMNPPTKAQTLGLSSLAGGGYLETGGEVGDGMSDEIEATIEGEQEARLSDGEFVIPADVVSHLGNGSSDAGAKRLYEMMDKIRMARTGTKKQGKEINPERYMPA